MRQPLRIGIVGSGFGAYGIAEACRMSGSFSPHFIVSRTQDRAQNAAQKYGIANAGTDARAMIASPEVDVVALAVPPDVQPALACFAFSQGKPVFAEKPLAANLDEARQMLAASAGIPNIVDFQLNELPSFAHARRLLADGRVGTIRHVGVRWLTLSHSIRNGIDDWKTDPARGGGALSHMASHSLHYLEEFCGPIVALGARIGASADLPGKETYGDLDFVFANGVVGELSVDVAWREMPCHIVEIVGSAGRIRLVGLLPNPVRFAVSFAAAGRSESLVFEDPIAAHGEADPRAAPIARLLARFRDWIVDGTENVPNFRNGYRVQQLIQTAKIASGFSGRIAVSN